LRYRRGPESDPFHYIFSSRGWLQDYDPPGEFPFWINLELTNTCQLDCLFCSRRLSARPQGHMDPGMAREIFSEAAGYPGAAVRFTGWGEPLLHPRIGEIASEAKKRGLKLKIYTNSLALTPKLFDLFLDIGLDDLQFSLQGLDGEQYEFNRRGARWHDTESRILMASERRGSEARPFLSILTSVLATELKGRDPDAFADRWLESVDKVAIDLTSLNFVSETEEARPYLDRQSSGLVRGRCVDVFLALEVKYDGSIQFCGQDSEGRECHTVGRFGEMSLSEAWRHPRLEAQRMLVGRALGHEGSPVCRNCYHNTTKYDLFKKAIGLAETAVEPNSAHVDAAVKGCGAVHGATAVKGCGAAAVNGGGTVHVAGAGAGKGGGAANGVAAANGTRAAHGVPAAKGAVPARAAGRGEATTVRGGDIGIGKERPEVGDGSGRTGSSAQGGQLALLRRSAEGEMLK
jgi:hypothetical protein